MNLFNFCQLQLLFKCQVYTFLNFYFTSKATKVNLPKSNRIPDAQEDFLLNQARFEVSPGPNLSLAARTDASFDLDSVDKTMLGKVVNVPQLQYALSGSEDSSDSLKDYFHHLTADAYGVLSDVLLGGLKRDLTASPYIPGKGYPVEAKGIKELLKLDDWNTLRIRAVGPTYTTWLNGEEVMNYTSASAIVEGPLGIQLHGGREMTIQYRNMGVTELAQQGQ